MFAHLLKHLDHSSSLGKVIPGIDSVRAIAIIFVLLCHLHALSGKPQVMLLNLDVKAWLANGFIGVDIFFTLSGFLLILPWAKSYYLGLPRPSLREYYRRRILRIVPAYYVHLVVFFLVLIPIFQSYDFLFRQVSYTGVTAYFTFTHFFFPDFATGFGLNVALWTLNIEAQFYLILPFLAPLFLGKRAWFGLLLMLSITVGWKYLSAHQGNDFIVQLNAYKYTPAIIQEYLSILFPAQLFHFGIGMMLGNYFSRQYFATGQNRSMNTTLELLVTFAAIVGLLWSMWFYPRIDLLHTYWFYTWRIIIAVSCVVLIWSSTFSNSFSRLFFDMPLMRSIGIISYSLYLWHLPIIFFVKTYMTPSTLNEIDTFYFLLVVSTPICLLVGYCSYIFIEKPCMEWRAKKTHA